MSNRDFGGAPGTNPPYHRLSPQQQRGSYRAWVATIVVIAVLVIGGAMYFSGEFSTPPATTTTGQSAAPHPATEPLTPETMPSPKPAPPK